MSRIVAAIINTGSTKPSADAFSCSIDEIARPTADAIPTADMYLRSVTLDIGISSVASSVSRPSSDPFRSPLAFFLGRARASITTETATVSVPAMIVNLSFNPSVTTRIFIIRNAPTIAEQTNSPRLRTASFSCFSETPLISIFPRAATKRNAEIIPIARKLCV